MFDVVINQNTMMMMKNVRKNHRKWSKMNGKNWLGLAWFCDINDEKTTLVKFAYHFLGVIFEQLKYFCLLSNVFVATQQSDRNCRVNIYLLFFVVVFAFSLFAEGVRERVCACVWCVFVCNDWLNNDWLMIVI